MNDPKATVPSSFPTTQWTQVISVMQKADDVAANAALAAFCERYRPAIYNFFLHKGHTPERAEDYTQSFFASRILSRWEDRSGFLHTIERDVEKRFRSFLCSVLWCFLKDQWKKEKTQKSGGSLQHVSLDQMTQSQEESDVKSFERFGREFDREFAIEIIRKAALRSKHSQYLEAHLRGELSQLEAAQKMGVSEGAFKQAFHHFKRRLAKDLWNEVSKLAGPDKKEIMAEIEYLMSLFVE